MLGKRLNIAPSGHGIAQSTRTITTRRPTIKAQRLDHASTDVRRVYVAIGGLLFTLEPESGVPLKRPKSGPTIPTSRARSLS